jgi:hypothetical protein
MKKVLERLPQKKIAIISSLIVIIIWKSLNSKRVSFYQSPK